MEFARQLERELSEARAEAAHWKANHDNQVAIKSALIQRPDLGDRAQRIEDLIKERDEAKAALSGRTVSCSNCNAMAAENAAMREAIKEAHSSISMCLHFMLQLPSYDHLVGIEIDTTELAHKSLSKLQPYLK